MLLDGLDDLRLRQLAPVGDAEGAVIRVAAGAAGDLRHFSRGQAAHLAAVELHVRSQRHMVQVEIQPHADGIGRHQEIHIAILVELDLGIAGARAEPPHHHRCAATLAPH